MTEHRGWHSRGYLPHFDESNLIQSVTFRLADSLPKAKLLELQAKLPKEKSAERRELIEEWLDRGAGSCFLHNPDCAAIIEAALLYDDSVRPRVLAWCIMPNHVHALLLVLSGHPLDKVLQAVKSVSAHRINKLLGRTGPVWEPEYFDRYIRSDEHFRQQVEYIEYNPVAAKLCADPVDWQFSSARRRAQGKIALQY